MEEIIITMILVVLLFLVVCNSYFLGYRNNRVSVFLLYVLKLSAAYELGQIKDDYEFKGHRHYKKLPSYNKLVFSFKVLELETFFYAGRN